MSKNYFKYVCREQDQDFSTKSQRLTRTFLNSFFHRFPLCGSTYFRTRHMRIKSQNTVRYVIMVEKLTIMRTNNASDSKLILTYRKIGL